MVQIGGRTGSSREQGSSKRPIRVRSPDFTPLRGRRDWPSRQSTGRGGDRRIRGQPVGRSIPSVSARAPTRTTRPKRTTRTHHSRKKDKEGHMRKITTAITAAALAFSMMAAAVPAAAVTGYDSAYAGESAFVNITGGQTQNFQVFFANVGTTSWQKGGTTEVDLAACLEDKVTCNAQDASEATWNSGWLSAVRYATTTQTITPPGSLGTFSYNIMAPVGVAAGIYHFNGDLVVSSTGERIHPEGYFQDANTGVSAGAATLTLINPNSGSSNGGDTVTITGSGIVCNPTFPTVSFGGTNGVVTSCGATALTVTTPAHATGSVTVTVTNPGAGASNGLTYVFADTTKPSFSSFTISKTLITATFSEPVCRTVVAGN